MRVYVVLEHGPLIQPLPISKNNLDPIPYSRTTSQGPYSMLKNAPVPMVPSLVPCQVSVSRKFEQIFILGKAHRLGLYPTPSKSITCEETLPKYKPRWLSFYPLHVFPNIYWQERSRLITRKVQIPKGQGEFTTTLKRRWWMRSTILFACIKNFLGDFLMQ